MISKNKNEMLICQLRNYKEYLIKLSKNNPERAKNESLNALIRIGIVNKDGKIKPPYNGKKVNENDFEYGPKSKIFKM